MWVEMEESFFLSFNNLTCFALCVEWIMVSLVGAVNGWSTFPLSTAVNSSISDGFQVTFQWLNFMQLAQ